MTVTAISRPPRGIRIDAPIEHLRRHFLPHPSREEVERLWSLLRRRPLPGIAAKRRAGR